MNWKKADFWVVVGLILLTGIVVNLLRYSEVKPQTKPDFSSIPLKLESWQGQDLYFSERTYEILKADQSLLRYFESPNGRAWLFIAYFGSQKYGSQIHSPKNCLPGSGWKIISKKKIAINLADQKGNKLQMNRFVISNGASRQMMLYWFVTRSGIITNEFGLKLDLVLNSIKRKPTDAAFVRINLPLEPGREEESWQTAVDFMNNFVPYINRALGF
jgi:EpsI family protein